ncbi:MAG: peptidylprolyl isomerase [candidate division KSB1 bacterium]|nr:peptidylprolyl isomerase [candidate division KSB1 bacterium]
MKRYFLLLVAAALLTAGCSKNVPKAPYAKGTEPYKFFRTLSDSLKITQLNPDKPVLLVTTKQFKIYSYDILPSIYARFNRYRNNIGRLPVEQFKNSIKEAAEGEAEKRLLLEEAKNKGIAASDSVVNEELEQIYSRRGGKENFQKFIEQQGLTIEYVEQDVRNQLTIQKFLEEVLEPQVQVTDADLQEAYSQDKLATVRHILFLTQGKNEAEKAEIKAKAEQVLARARSGEDFAALAKEFSEDPGSKDKGGIYERFPRGRMVKPFEDAAFNLPIGSISDLVETPYGYHIIKVESREKETLPLEEVRDQLTRTVERTKRRDIYNQFIEDLKKKAEFKVVELS